MVAVSQPLFNKGIKVKLTSKIDNTVNWTTKAAGGGIFESRFVQRNPDYFVCYLSSHTGCNKACRFCHLTQTGQTNMQDATPEDLMEQALKVLTYAKHANQINYNFMARGEPLANEHILMDWSLISNNLKIMAALRGINKVELNISTIMPENLRLHHYFTENYPTIYYSLYSLNKPFRKKWLPKAIYPILALDRLKEYQESTGANIVFHWPFIEGENDNEIHLHLTMGKIESYNFTNPRFNLVRYNPPNDKSKESQHYKNCLNIVSRYIPTKEIDRVGFDVKASCGMFLQGELC